MHFQRTSLMVTSNLHSFYSFTLFVDTPLFTAHQY
jgi:hypothetical protein